jgi:GGDEF domain-containing protein
VAKIKTSIVVAERGEGRQSMEALQQIADQAMYLAKQAGRRINWTRFGVVRFINISFSTFTRG